MNMENNPAGRPSGGEPARSRGFRRLVDFFLLSFGYVGLRFLIGPIRSRLLTEQLGKPLYGALTLAVTTVTFLAMILALGSYEFLARRLPGLAVSRQKGWLSLVLRRIALPAWLLAGAVAAALCALGRFGGWSWNAGDVLFLWLAFGLMLWLLFRINYAMGCNRIAVMRAIQLFQNDIWFLVVFGLGSWAAASFSHTLWIWTGWLAAVALCVLAFDRRPDPAAAPRGEGLREVLGFSLPLMPMIIGEILFRLADRYLLLAYFDMSTVAEYILAMNIAMMGYVTGGSLLEISLPHLYAAANRHAASAPPPEEVPDAPLSAAGRVRSLFRRSAMQPTDEMRKIFSLMLRHVTGLGAVMGLGMAFFRRDIFAIVAGPEFRNAASLMPWIAGIPLTFLLVLAAWRALLVQNRTAVVGAAMLAAAVLNLLVDLVVVPLWGTHGAAMATLGSLLLLSVFLFSVLDVPRWIDRSVWRPVHQLFGIAGCAVAYWLITTFLPDASHWIRLPLAALPALLVCWLAKIFTASDMALLKAANTRGE